MSSDASKAGKLDRYNEMRDFGRTDEPAGEVQESETGFSFVVQKHAARALHYDFRLELDGVLLSWAVPKGPSLSTKDKRLAVQTEDHPVDYRDFEGMIPKGEYGGGAVIVWDRGTWEPMADPREGLKRGRLDFVLHGEKLQGRWMLVRTGAKTAPKSQWLLMKRSDENVKHGPEANIVERLPQSVLTGRTIEDVKKGIEAKGSDPMPEPAAELATLVDDIPARGDWIYEIKYDGYRALAILDRKKKKSPGPGSGLVQLVSRNGKDWTKPFAPIAQALVHVRADTAIFDGEVAYVKDDGRTDFQLLQNALGEKGGRDRLVYFVFDLLYYDGVDLRDKPLSFRKDKLRTIFAGEKPPLRFSDHVTDGRAFFEEACKLGLEGIIAKRADSTYIGKRTKDWLKIKCQQRQELAIVGFTPPQGSRKGIGALLLGLNERGSYRYAGKVGTGFTQASLKELHEKLSKLVVEKPPIENAPRMKGATWVKPELVCEVRFTEWTREGSLRHPSFLGLRSDKTAKEAHRERPQPVARAAKPRAKAVKAKTKEMPRVEGVAVSHPERVVDESIGLTKLDLVSFAAAVAPHAIVFAKKRPLMLLRCPDGFRSCFVQKHSGRGLIGLDDLHSTMIEDEEALYVESERGLVELAQFNAIELHGWGSRVPKWDRPDWIVFDLDPDEALPFTRVIEGAFELREALDSLGLVSFVKTTGGKGLHVVVPLAQKQDWDTVRTFSEAIAKALTKRSPDRYVATMTKRARKGKVFIDFFRNGQGATAILPYSARARPGSGVAYPVSWKDLPNIDPKDFTVRTVPSLLAKRKKDPWADLVATKQSLSRKILKAIGSDEAD